MAETAKANSSVTGAANRVSSRSRADAAQLRGWTPTGDLRVNPEDWRIYDLQALLLQQKQRRCERDILLFWELECVPVANHPTTAFAMRQLGLQHAGGRPGCSRYVLSHVPAPTTPRVFSQEEARFDAHQDTCFSHGQLLEIYSAEYCAEDIDAYWHDLPPWWRPPEFGCVSWSHTSLHRNLCLHGILRTSRVLDAVLQTDRMHYSPNPALAYYETAQEFGEDATLSSPRIHICCLEAVAASCKQGANVLDIGCGTGFTAAVLARMVGPLGRVLGLDVTEDYVDLTIKNVHKDDPTLVDSGRVRACLGDGWWGAEESGPFDVIHMACSAPSVPEPLLRQLKEGGRLLLPLGPATPAWQNLTVITRHHGGEFSAEVLRPVRYVTMVHPPLMLSEGPSTIDNNASPVVWTRCWTDSPVWYEAVD